MLIHKYPRYERMRCTRIKKNKCRYRTDMELTNHNIRLLIDLLHIDMVHMPLVERIGLDNSIPIGLRLWAVCGIVSHVLALETLDVTQVLWCMAILTVVSIASIGSIASPIPIVPSIAIPIPVTIVVVVAIMVVTISTMMVMSSTVNMAIPTIVVMSMVMSSIATMRNTWLLMRSRVILSTIVVVVLPLAVLNGLLLAFQHNSLVYERLAVSKSSHFQLDSQLIIQPLQELLMPCSIIPDIIWSISGKLVEHLNILGH